MWWILLSHYKEWNNAVCSKIDGPRDYHTKWSKLEINIIWYHLYVKSKKNDANELSNKAEMDALTEHKLMVTKRERGGYNF